MYEPRDHTRLTRQRSIDQIDNITGEVLSEGALVWVPNRTPHPYGTKWMAMTLDGLEKLTATPGIGMREMRIFAVLLKRLDHENFILIPHTEIVQLTGFHASHVSASMKRLLEVGALIPGPKVGRSQTYRLSPEIGWRGSKKNLQSALSVINGGKTSRV